VENDILPILYSIGIAHVTSRGGIMSLVHRFNSLGEGTKSEACHAADNVMRKVKKHVSGRMYGECVTRALFVGRVHQ